MTIPLLTRLNFHCSRQLSFIQKNYLYIIDDSSVYEITNNKLIKYSIWLLYHSHHDIIHDDIIHHHHHHYSVLKSRIRSGDIILDSFIRYGIIYPQQTFALHLEWFMDSDQGNGFQIGIL